MQLRHHPLSRLFGSGVLGAVLFCLTPLCALAQAPASPPGSAACEPAGNDPSAWQCLNEKAAAVDAPLAQKLQQFSVQLPPKPREQLQTQQRDWAQRRDKECTPTDRPASDSNALASATLCRSQMGLQRMALLEGIQLPTQKPPDDGLTCLAGQEATLACLQQRQATLEYSGQVLYISLMLGLPEAQAQALHTEQSRWQAERGQSCRPNGYRHEQEDQAVCRIRMTLERVKVYKTHWYPIAKIAKGEAKP